MKKTGTFFLCFTPFLLGIGLQFLTMFYLLILAAVFIYIIAPITGTYLESYEFMDLMSDLNFNGIIMIVFSISCMATFGIWYYKSCGGNYRLDFKHRFHPFQLLGILFLVPGIQFLTNLLISLMNDLFPSWVEAYVELMENAGLDDEISIILLIYTVLCAPISEELIFRGVTMRIARRAFPFWFANILQAMLFGIFHMNLVQGLYAFILGLVLGYICESSNNIYLAILLHFFFNLWGSTASNWLTDANPIFLSIFVFLSLFVGIAAGFYFFRKGNQAIKKAL